MKALVKILFVNLILISFGYAQINKTGLPLIENYTNKVYKAHQQNWAIVQDSNGIMYFGNTLGVLLYNGEFWKKIETKNKTMVRSLAIDSSNIIYVGSIDDFGYLYPDKLGQLKYFSFSQQDVDSTINIGDVWKIYAFNNTVYFCTYEHIFIYKSFNFVKNINLPAQTMFSFVVDNNIYVGNYEYGILEYKNDTLEPIKGSEFYREKNIASILAYGPKKLLISTFNNGVFVYNKQTGENTLFLDKKSLSLVKQGILYHTTQLTNGDYAYAIVYKGVLVTDNNGTLKYFVDETNGLLGKMPFYIYQNKGPAWIAQNDGISKFSINLPVTYYSISEKLGSTINALTKFNNIIYIGTDDGVYYIDENGEFPELRKTKINKMVWQFVNFKTKNDKFVLVGTQEGVYMMRDTNNILSVEDNIQGIKLKGKFITSFVYQLKNTNNLIITTRKNIFTLKYAGNNKWKKYQKYPIGITVNDISTDNNEILWLGTALSGVIKAKFSDSLQIIKKYQKNIGLENLTNIKPFVFNNEVYFSTLEGIFKLQGNKIVKEGFAHLPANTHIYSIFKLKNGKIAFVINKNIEKRFVYLYDKKSDYLDTISFNFLPDAREEIKIIEPVTNKFIISYGTKLFYFEYDKKDYDKFIPKSKIIEVHSNDNLIFGGIFVYKNNDSLSILNKQTDEIVPILEYSQNDLKFMFVSPYYLNEEKVLYSYKLEGNDKNWSKWSTQNYAYKNNLYEGEYVFKVKAKNEFGKESAVSEYRFIIKPPWYRTIWMYIIYAILAIALIIFIVYLNSRRLIKEKLRLEQIVKERTAEVVAQKAEIEAQRDEITAQRDLVMEQKEHIEKIHGEITDSIYYAQRIQRAILPVEDHVNKAVPEHFILFKPKDIVSGDYYWASILQEENKKDNKFIGKLVITAADCTGHGVPGAFMSMLGVSFLNEIVNEKKVDRPDMILNMMRENVITSLQQKGEEGEQKDGMDMSLCIIDIEKMRLQYAGANNPLYIIRKKDLPNLEPLNADAETKEIENDEYRLLEIKADKMPIAIYIEMRNFKLNEVNLLSGDTIYMFSDGYADQFGGPKGKKFKYKPFKELLLNIQDLSMYEQKAVLDKTIEDWKSTINKYTKKPHEQIDDIVVIGIKIP